MACSRYPILAIEHERSGPHAEVPLAFAKTKLAFVELPAFQCERTLAITTFNAVLPALFDEPVFRGIVLSENF